MLLKWTKIPGLESEWLEMYVHFAITNTSNFPGDASPLLSLTALNLEGSPVWENHFPVQILQIIKTKGRKKHSGK